MNLRGTLPALILQTLATGPRHGYAIAQFIKQRSKGVLDFREGTLYPALHNLENKGLLDSYEEPENGRIRRYYRLTESGISALNAEVEEWKSISGAIGAILNAKRATT